MTRPSRRLNFSCRPSRTFADGARHDILDTRRRTDIVGTHAAAAHVRTGRVAMLKVLQNSDGDTFGRIRTALDRRPDIPASVHVHVANGVVTMTGSVRLPSEVLAAESVVRGIKGVRHVVNRITVSQVSNAQGFEQPPQR